MPPMLQGLNTLFQLQGMGANRAQAMGGIGGAQQQPQSLVPPLPPVDIVGAFETGKTAAEYARGGAVKGYTGGGPVADDGAMPSFEGDGTGVSGLSPQLIELTKRMMAGTTDDTPTSEDKGLALAQAGFSIAGGQSPFALSNIGAGASSGIEMLQKLKQQRAVQRMKQEQMQQTGLLRVEALEQAKQAAKDKAEALKQASQDRQDAIQQRADAAALADQTRQDAIAARADAAAQQRLISQQLADAALQRAQAAADAAPKGVTPPTKERAAEVGVPFHNIPNPYANVSPKAAEDMYKSNEKIFENRQTKNMLVEGKNQELSADLDRFAELNSKDITGPSNNITGVGGVKKFFSPELQELGSIESRMAPNMRQLLPGAASDKDVAMFKDSGPSVGKDMVTNSNRIMGLKAATLNQNDKEQFMRDFFEVHHHTQGADKAWRSYLNANPIFDHGKGVSPFTLNSGRKSYQEYFGGQAPAAPVKVEGVLPPPAAGTQPRGPEQAAAPAGIAAPPSAMPVPGPNAIIKLRSNPHAAAEFDARYGVGAAAKILGAQ